MGHHFVGFHQYFGGDPFANLFAGTVHFNFDAIAAGHRISRGGEKRHGARHLLATEQASANLRSRSDTVDFLFRNQADQQHRAVIQY